MSETWGFLALNNSNQVLVSSQTRNLHFVGKFRFESLNGNSNYGGMLKYTFIVFCAVTPVPFFTQTVEGFTAVASIKETSSGVWEIVLIASGLVLADPELYVFSDPRGISARDSAYGMLVLRDDGTPSFDSRLSPLVITGGTTVSPPNNPLTVLPAGLDSQYCNSNASDQFKPTNLNSFGFSASGSKPIFFYPSLAQTQREALFASSEDECDGLIDLYGNCVGFQRHYEWKSRYWAFYRSGIRYTGSTIECGWITVEFGCNWTYAKDSTFIGIGIGGSSGTSGTWPYSNETLNLTPTSIISSDGSLYD